MPELKPGWRRVALGDVVQVVTDYWDRDPSIPHRFVAGEHIDEGSLRIRRWGLTSDTLVPPTFNRRFLAGDVLFHSRNLRKLACPDFDGITGEKLFVLRSKDPTQLLPTLLPFLLQTEEFDEYVNRMWAGSTNKFLNKAPLIRFDFVLPPLEEQRRIAHLLSALECVRIELQEAYERAKKLRDRIRVEMCERASKWRKLNHYLEFLTSGSRGWSAHYSDAGEVFLRIGNLNSPSIDLNLNEVQHVRAPKDAEAARTRVRQYDVLLGITGESGVGLVGFVREANLPTFISQHIALIRLNANAVPEFVAHVLAGPFGQRQVRRFNQAGAKAGMTLISVRDLVVPEYSVDDQRRWAEQVSEVEQTMAQVLQRWVDAKNISKNLRNIALNGEQIS